MLTQVDSGVKMDFTELPEVWQDRLRPIQDRIEEAQGEADTWQRQAVVIEGRLRYWKERLSKLTREYDNALSGFDPRIYQMADEQSELHPLIIERFGDDFEIEHEVFGRYQSDDATKRAKIDFLFYPKDHIVKLGFPRVWFGVEAKLPGKNRKGNELIKQAEDYMGAIFNRPKAGIEDVQLFMVLIYPAIDYFYTLPDVAKEIKVHAHKSRVGSLGYHQATRYRGNHWSIKFADETAYFYSDSGLVNQGAVLNNTYLGNGVVK